MARSSQLQIRVTPAEKARLKRQAAAAGMDVSAWVMARLLPSEPVRFVELTRGLADEAERPYGFAELNDFLSALPAARFGEAVAVAPSERLSDYLRNYIAAMVEQAAMLKSVGAPAWARTIEPLEQPVFGTTLRSLRPHLLRTAPVVFKRRNIFVDAAIGARV